MYEYKGRMRRDEIALDMARMLRDYQETLETDHFEDQKVLLETCYALTDKNHDVGMKLSGLRTDLNSKNWEKSTAIRNEYRNVEKDYWKKQNERSHRLDIVWAIITTFVNTSFIFLMILAFVMKKTS